MKQNIMYILFLILFQAFDSQCVYGGTLWGTDTTSVVTDSVKIRRSAAFANSNFYNTVDVGTAPFVPKAPNAAGLVQHIDCPVSYYTGIPEISIPLYEIDVQGVKIPITLSYHASGIRMSQEATWVGLGWSLSCGGIISRTVRCGDDFYEYPESNSNDLEEGYLDAPEVSGAIDKEYFKSTSLFFNYKLVKDSEPDIFFYSIPGGSGKFVIDKSRGPVLFTRGGNSSVKIELLGKKSGKFGSYTFKITDTQGTQFFFDKKEKTTVFSGSGQLNRNSFNATVFDEFDQTVRNKYETPFIYTSSWMLTKIVTPKGQEIVFNYDQEEYQLPTQESVVKYNYISTSGPGTSGITTLPLYSCSKTAVEGYRLTGISWNAGSVDFEASAREDIKVWESGNAPKKLDKITVRNKQGDIIRQYALSYRYMNPERSDKYKHVFKRLMLDGVTDCIDTSIKYNMAYYTGSLPAKNSKDTDYYGYYNGKRQGENYYAPAYHNGNLYEGADKNGNLNYMRIGTLESITYPTGEKTSFVYDTFTTMESPIPINRTVYKYLTTFYSYETTGKYTEDEDCDYSDYPREASVRMTIDKKTSFGIFGSVESTSQKPDYDWLYDSNDYPMFCIYRVNSDGTKNENAIYTLTVPYELRYNNYSKIEDKTISLPAGTYIFESYSPIKDMYLVLGVKYTVHTPESPIVMGGLRIKEINGTDKRSFTYTGGVQLVSPVTYYQYTENYFHDNSDYYTATYLVQNSESVVPMSTLKDGYIYGYSSVSEKRAGYAANTYYFHNEPEERNSDYPFMPTVLNCFNGLKVKEVIGGTALGSLQTEYEYSCPQENTVYGFIYKYCEANYHKYKYDIIWPQLIQKTTTRKENNGTMTEDTYYTYNSDYQLETEKFISNGKTYTKKYVYAGGKDGDVFTNMAAKHIISVPVETQILQGTQVIKAAKTEYKDTLGMILPSATYITNNKTLLASDFSVGAYRPEVTYSRYSPMGNPVEVRTNEGISVVLWGYNGMYPIAEIKNCTYADVAARIGESVITNAENSPKPDDTFMAAIDGLRTVLTASDITTMTYKPLVGVTSMTDARGFRVDYSYDTSGRLIEEYFMENGTKRTLKKYTYHYAGKE